MSRWPAWQVHIRGVAPSRAPAACAACGALPASARTTPSNPPSQAERMALPPCGVSRPAAAPLSSRKPTLPISFCLAAYMRCVRPRGPACCASAAHSCLSARKARDSSARRPTAAPWPASAMYVATASRRSVWLRWLMTDAASARNGRGRGVCAGPQRHCFFAGPAVALATWRRGAGEGRAPGGGWGLATKDQSNSKTRTEREVRPHLANARSRAPTHTPTHTHEAQARQHGGTRGAARRGSGGACAPPRRWHSRTQRGRHCPW